MRVLAPGLVLLADAATTAPLHNVLLPVWKNHLRNVRDVATATGHLGDQAQFEAAVIERSVLVAQLRPLGVRLLIKVRTPQVGTFAAAELPDGGEALRAALLTLLETALLTFGDDAEAQAGHRREAIHGQAFSVAALPVEGSLGPLVVILGDLGEDVCACLGLLAEPLTLQ